MSSETNPLKNDRLQSSKDHDFLSHLPLPPSIKLIGLFFRSLKNDDTQPVFVLCIVSTG